MSYFSVFTRANGPTTPQSPPRRRSSTSSSNSTSTQELDQLLDRQTVSPMRRTRRWLEGPSPNITPSAPNLHRVSGSRVVKDKGQNNKDKRKSFWGLQLLSGLFGKVQDEKDDDGLEGDTIVEDENSLPATELDNDLTLVEVDGEVIKVEFEEQSDKSLRFHEPAVQQRTNEEKWLYTKLSRLGRQPLLPRSWNMDFPTFPAYLFSSDPARAFINNNHTTISHAAGALQDLISAGSHARAQVLRKSPPEKSLFRSITKYHKWSQLDGQFKHKTYIPVLAIACARPKEKTESVVRRLTDTLHSLGAQYRDKYRHPDCHVKDDDNKEQEQRYTHELPTLYGILIKYTVVAIVTCDSKVPKKPISAIATYDWNKGNGQDVWQAFGVAVTIVKARNWLMGLDAEGELGEERVESDPDA